jgi:hypothetical protein
MNRRWFRANSAVALLACAALGCSTTATIMRTSGPPIEASIEGGSPSSIVLEGGAVVPRSEVVEVDHPGNVHAVVGGVVLGYGLLNIAAGSATCGDSGKFSSKGEQNGYCIGMVTPALVGVGMLIWGLVVHSGSKSALNDTSHALAEPEVAPNGPYAPFAPGQAPPPPAQPPLASPPPVAPAPASTPSVAPAPATQPAVAPPPPSSSFAPVPSAAPPAPPVAPAPSTSPAP